MNFLCTGALTAELKLHSRGALLNIGAEMHLTHFSQPVRKILVILTLTDDTSHLADDSYITLRRSSNIYVA